MYWSLYHWKVIRKEQPGRDVHKPFPKNFKRTRATATYKTDARCFNDQNLINYIMLYQNSKINSSNEKPSSKLTSLLSFNGSSPNLLYPLNPTQEKKIHFFVFQCTWPHSHWQLNNRKNMESVIHGLFFNFFIGCSKAKRRTYFVYLSTTSFYFKINLEILKDEQLHKTRHILTLYSLFVVFNKTIKNKVRKQKGKRVESP